MPSLNLADIADLIRQEQAAGDRTLASLQRPSQERTYTPQERFGFIEQRAQALIQAHPDRDPEMLQAGIDEIREWREVPDRYPVIEDLERLGTERMKRIKPEKEVQSHPWGAVKHSFWQGVKAVGGGLPAAIGRVIPGEDPAERIGRENKAFYDQIIGEDPDIKAYVQSVQKASEGFATEVLGNLGPTAAGLGMAFIPFAGPVLSMGMFYDLNTEEIETLAKAKGATEQEAHGLSVAGGMINTALDMVGISRMMKVFRPAKKLANFLVGLGLTSGIEGGTEGVQGVVAEILSDWAAKPKEESAEAFVERQWRKKDDLLKTFMHDAKIGAAIGGGAHVVGAGTGAAMTPDEKTIDDGQGMATGAGQVDAVGEGTAVGGQPPAQRGLRPGGRADVRGAEVAEPVGDAQSEIKEIGEEDAREEEAEGDRLKAEGVTLDALLETDPEQALDVLQEQRAGEAEILPDEGPVAPPVAGSLPPATVIPLPAVGGRRSAVNEQERAEIWEMVLSDGFVPEDQRSVDLERMAVALEVKLPDGYGRFELIQGIKERLKTVRLKAEGEEGKGETGGKGIAETEKKSVHDYSSTQVDLPDEVADSIKGFAAKIPDSEIYTEKDDPSYGREDEPHITVRYGMETVNAEEIAPAFEGLGPIKATLGKVSIFEADDYDVVKVDIESPDLKKANKRVGETVELPGETHKDYTPHATIAYVKKGEGKKYAGDTAFEGQTVIIDAITLSAKDGKMHKIPLAAKPEEIEEAELAEIRTQTAKAFKTEKAARSALKKAKKSEFDYDLVEAEGGYVWREKSEKPTADEKRLLEEEKALAHRRELLRNAPDIRTAIKHAGGIRRTDPTHRGDIRDLSRGEGALPPSLFSKTGLGMDEMVDAMIQEQWIGPDSTEDDLMQAIQRNPKHRISGEGVEGLLDSQLKDEYRRLKGLEEQERQEADKARQGGESDDAIREAKKSGRREGISRADLELEEAYKEAERKGKAGEYDQSAIDALDAWFAKEQQSLFGKPEEPLLTPEELTREERLARAQDEARKKGLVRKGKKPVFQVDKGIKAATVGRQRGLFENDQGQIEIEFKPSEPATPLEGAPAEIRQEVRMSDTGGTVRAASWAVRDMDEAASLLSKFAVKPQENLFLLTTDKSGNVLEVHHYVKGHKSGAEFVGSETAGRVLNIPNAHTIYYVHNHPTGDPTASPEDISALKTLKKILDLGDVRIQGFVLGRDTWAPIDTGIQTPIKKTDESVEIPLKERGILIRRPNYPEGQTMRGPKDALRVLKDVYQNREGFLLLDRKNKDIGFLPFVPGRRMKDITRDLVAITEKTNASYIVFNSQQDITFGTPRAKYLEDLAYELGGDPGILDIIDPRGSHADRGLFVQNKKFAGRNVYRDGTRGVTFQEIGSTRTLFSRAKKGAGAKPPKGLSIPVVKNLSESLSKVFKGLRAHEIVTLSSDAELPPGVAVRARAGRAEPEGFLTRGLYDTDPETGKRTIYLFSGAMDTRRDVIDVFVHEGFHDGVATALGDKAQPLLAKIYKENQAAVGVAAEARGLDPETEKGRGEATEEWIVEGMVKDTLPQSVWDHIVRAVKAMLRKAGINVRYGYRELGLGTRYREGDIRGVIRDAVVGGRESAVSLRPRGAYAPAGSQKSEVTAQRSEVETEAQDVEKALKEQAARRAMPARASKSLSKDKLIRWIRDVKKKGERPEARGPGIRKEGKVKPASVATLTGTREEKVSALRRFGRHFKEFWQPFSTVPEGEQALAARYKGMGDAARSLRYIEKIHEKLDAFPDAVKKDLFRFMDGQIDEKLLPVEARALAESLKEKTAIIGRMLVDRDIISRETFDAHKGRYVHYMYAAHILGDKLGGVTTSTGKLNLTYAKQRKDLTAEERKALGLIEDAAIAVPVGMGKALTDIAKHDYLEKIAANDKWVWAPSMVEIPRWPRRKGQTATVQMGIGKLIEEVDKYKEMAEKAPSEEVKKKRDILQTALDRAIEATKNVPGDYTQVPTTQTYGPLAGAYLKTPIAKDLMPVMDMYSDRGKVFEALARIEAEGMAMFKMGKVALNLPTAFRNVISNVMQNNMRGRPLAMIPGDVVAACKSMKARDAYYEEAFGNGIFNTNWFVTEINDVLDEFRKAEGGSYVKILTAVKRVARLYGKIDDINKHAIFVQMRKAGHTVDESVLEAMKWGMDYSLASRSVKHLRRHLVPFLSYQYKIAPLIAESLRKRPWVIGKFMAIPLGMEMLTRWMHDLDDDDWDDLEKQLPAYIKKSESMMVLPWKTPEGQWQWVNAEYFFPWGNYLNLGRDLSAGDAGEIYKGLGISNPYLDIARMAASAKRDQPPQHPFYGTPLYNRLDPAPVKAAKVIQFLAFTWMPSMLSPEKGALGYSIKAIEGKRDKWDKKVTPAQAAARWFGANIVAVSPSQTRAIAAVNIQDLRKELYRIKNDPSKSEAEKAAAEKRYRERLAEIAETGASGAVLPITKKKGKDPVYDTLIRMLETGASLPGPPGRTFLRAGVQYKMSNDQYERYLERSSGLARPRLERLMAADGWANRRAVWKEQRIKKIVAAARKRARSEMKRRMGQRGLRMVAGVPAAREKKRKSA